MCVVTVRVMGLGEKRFGVPVCSLAVPICLNVSDFA